MRRLVDRQLARIAAVASIGLWGQMVLIYLGINHANSAIAAIIVGLEPVLIAVWAALLLGERFGAPDGGRAGVGLAGSLLVAGLRQPGRRQPRWAAVPARHRGGVLVVHGRQQGVPGRCAARSS